MENVVKYSRWGNEGGGGKYQTAERRRLACSACWQISIPATVKMSTLSLNKPGSPALPGGTGSLRNFATLFAYDF